MNFKKDAGKYLLKHGRLVKDEGGFTYGWHDYMNDFGGYRDIHKPGCHWVLNGEGRIIEKTFYEFDGTENDSLQSTLLILTDVDCSCGALTGRRLGMQGTTGELLHQILGIVVEYE